MEKVKNDFLISTGCCRNIWTRKALSLHPRLPGIFILIPPGRGAFSHLLSGYVLDSLNTRKE